ncbi:hypothetical protein D9M68_740080 [compost metagenome]
MIQQGLLRLWSHGRSDLHVLQLLQRLPRRLSGSLGRIQLFLRVIDTALVNRLLDSLQLAHHPRKAVGVLTGGGQLLQDRHRGLRLLLGLLDIARLQRLAGAGLQCGSLAV